MESWNYGIIDDGLVLWDPRLATRYSTGEVGLGGGFYFGGWDGWIFLDL